MASKSSISLNIILRKDTPQYIIDFFQKGIKNDEIPSVLYTHGFEFDNKPRFSNGTNLFFEEQNGRYFLNIYHRFDFETEAAEGFWLVGGLAQFAEDSSMAGYVTHADGLTQIFGFRDKMCFWKNDLHINFKSAKYKNPDLKIREMMAAETPFLEEMLFQAIFTPKGKTPPEKSIIFEPFLHHYIEDFGKKNDVALIAEMENKLIGAIWLRLFAEDKKGYGFVDNHTPELSMAVDFLHRNGGIGAILLKEMLEKSKNLGYKQVSLSVDKRNFAYQLYLKFGFEVHKIDSHTVTMLNVL